MGIVIIRLNNGLIITLYPYYHIPDNQQITFSPNALKKYNHSKSARIESLAWFRVVDPCGKSIRVTSDPIKIQTKSMDYINVNIIIPRLIYSTTFSLSPVSTSKSSHPIHIMPLINNDFTKIRSLDYTIIHRRLTHTCNKVLKKCTNTRRFLIYPQGSTLINQHMLMIAGFAGKDL